MRVALFFAALAACGGSTPAPAPTPTHTENTPDASGVSSMETDSGPPPTASVVSPPAMADAGAPAPTASNDPAEQATLVCGTAQMPFEQKLRPAIKNCFFEAKVKNPALTGKVKIVLNVS